MQGGGEAVSGKGRKRPAGSSLAEKRRGTLAAALPPKGTPDSRLCTRCWDTGTPGVPIR